ncbi:YybH family protein [Streptomyces sp. NPDC054849]
MVQRPDTAASARSTGQSAPGAGYARRRPEPARRPTGLRGFPIGAYTAGDIALLIVDWSIEGTGPDGAAVRLAGTATDVARRGPDGLWRYVVDNPFGTSPA